MSLLPGMDVKGFYKKLYINNEVNIMNRIYLIGFTCIFIWLALVAGTGALAKGGKQANKEAIRITSDTMEAMDEKGIIIFKGNVKAKKGELTILCDELKVFYSLVSKDKVVNAKKGRGAKGTKNAHNGGKRKVKRLVAKNNVKIVRSDMTATSKKAVYEPEIERIILTSDVKVRRGKNRISGNKIVFYIKEGKTIVEGGKGKRVEAFVITNEE